MAQGFAMYANAHYRAEGAQAWEPDHFLGKPRQAYRRQTPAEMRAVVRGAMSVKTGSDEIPEWAKVASKPR